MCSQINTKFFHPVMHNVSGNKKPAELVIFPLTIEIKIHAVLSEEFSLRTNHPKELESAHTCSPCRIWPCTYRILVAAPALGHSS